MYSMVRNRRRDGIKGGMLVAGVCTRKLHLTALYVTKMKFGICIPLTIEKKIMTRRF